jgi:hypothetical protein
MYEKLLNESKIKLASTEHLLYLKAGIIYEGSSVDINDMQFTQVKKVMTPSSIKQLALDQLHSSNGRLAGDREKTSGELEFEAALELVHGRQ